MGAISKHVLSKEGPAQVGIYIYIHMKPARGPHPFWVVLFVVVNVVETIAMQHSQV
jgi:hypothetical protein